MALKSSSLQKGSTLLLGLFFILIASLAAFLSFAYASQLTIQHHSRQICRTEVMLTQRMVKHPIKVIMLLNPMVSLLKNMNSLSTIAFFIPGMQEVALTVKLKAEQWLAHITKLQKSLISAIRMWTATRNWITQNKMRFYLLKQKYINKNQRLNYRDVRIKMDSEFPAIRRKDPQERFSEYKWAENFEENQSITLTWKVKWTEGLTYQIIRLLTTSSTRLSSSFSHLGCSATLNRFNKSSLEAKLFEDPSLSNVRFFF